MIVELLEGDRKDNSSFIPRPLSPRGRGEERGMGQGMRLRARLWVLGVELMAKKAVLF